MSQYPPPPGQPPFGQQPVPPQYGQPSPYGQPGYPQRPRGTSGAAIGSLICGILGCIPFITSILAIILGIVGIKATGNNRAGGRGMAIAGLILGLLGIAGWGLFGGGMYALYIGSRPVKAVAEQFTKDMIAGDVSAAMTRCDPNMAEADLQAASDTMKSWGNLTNLTLFGASAESTNGVTEWQLAGSAQFASTSPKKATFTLKKESDGSYKITKFNFE